MSSLPLGGKQPQHKAPGDPGESHWARPHYDVFHDYLIGQKGLANYTVRNYLSDLGTFWKFLDREQITGLKAVTRDTLGKYLFWLLSTAKPSARNPKLGRDYARRSVLRRLVGLRMFFHLVQKQGIIEIDPTLKIDSLKLDKRLPQFLEREKVDVLLKAPPEDEASGLRDKAILELLYACGMRVSEIVGMNVSDVNLAERQARVLGKGSKERRVLFGEPAKHAVQKYLQIGRSEFCQIEKETALFVNNRGTRLSARSVQKLVRGYAGRAGLGSGVHTHTLRHTFATHLLDGGADLRVVQELLGHSSPATTEIYTHVTQAQARKAYEKAHPRSDARRRDASDANG
ncbi:MAG: tyrosine recombinase [Dehalococcoidia bacterium]|nr:tyrosine recombinase [Dehalococcoidia bacterium]